VTKSHLKWYDDEVGRWDYPAHCAHTWQTGGKLTIALSTLVNNVDSAGTVATRHSKTYQRHRTLGTNSGG
jgi:hypothetical protein